MDPQESFWARPTAGSPAPPTLPPPTALPPPLGRPTEWIAPPYPRGRPEPLGAAVPVPTRTASPVPARPATAALITLALVGTLVLALAGTGIGVMIGRAWPESSGARTLAPPPVSSTVEPTSGSASTPTMTSPEPPTTASAAPSQTPASGRDVYGDLSSVVENQLYDLHPQPLECQGLALPVPEGRRLEPWAEQALACLHDHYAPVTEAAGYTLTAPSLTFFTDQVDTPCGDGATGAFYCAQDEGIYIQRGIYTNDAGRLNTIRMLLHEFSHHVQNRIGILGDDKYGREPVPVISRRIELQASCWTGMQLRDSQWLGWSARDERWLEQFNSVDSDEMHGQARSRHHWYREGRSGTTFAACNTWLADRELVA